MENSCINCKYSKESADGEHCSNCSHNAVDNFEKMTNADHIRSMTDEELAELISSGKWACICPMCEFYGTTDCAFDEDYGTEDKKICAKGVMKWLQSPVEV